MTESNLDERIAPRIEKDSTIFIELGADASNIIICKSLDLSMTGVQVLVDEPILEGCILRLCLDSQGKAPIFVVARVVWQKSGTDGFHIGFKLLPSKGTDFQSWETAIEEIHSTFIA